MGQGFPTTVDLSLRADDAGITDVRCCGPMRIVTRVYVIGTWVFTATPVNLPSTGCSCKGTRAGRTRLGHAKTMIQVANPASPRWQSICGPPYCRLSQEWDSPLRPNARGLGIELLEPHKRAGLGSLTTLWGSAIPRYPDCLASNPRPKRRIPQSPAGKGWCSVQHDASRQCILLEKRLYWTFELCLGAELVYTS